MAKMNQFITISLELTARNLEILKQLCDDQLPAPIANLADAHPVENPFPEPQAEAKPQARTKPVDERPKITAQDVKAVCLKLSKAGKQAELKAAFAKFGGKKLSDIAESDFGALLEELGDA